MNTQSEQHYKIHVKIIGNVMIRMYQYTIIENIFHIFTYYLKLMFHFQALTCKLLTTIQSIVSYQYKRYASKNLPILVSLSIFVSYFTLYPDLIAMIWPYLLARFPKIPLYVGTITFINVFITVAYSAVMYVIYTGKFPFFQQYRSSKEPWLWETNEKQWRSLFKKTIINVVVNLMIITPTLLTLDSYRSFKVKIEMEEIPESKLTYVWQFCIFLIANQIWSFLMHALIHHPKLYWIHKMHHEYAVPIAISGIYVHPVQYLLSSVPSTALGYKIIMNFYPVHIFSIVIWLTFRMVEINDSHCGYIFPWFQSAIIPFTIPDNYHYYHHRVNQGNYAGILYFLDSFCGTNSDYWKYEQKLVEKYGQGNKNNIQYGKQY